MAKGILWATVVDTMVVDALATMPARPRHTHVTLQFGVEADAVAHMVGVAGVVRVLGLARNHDIEALVVALPEGMVSTNAVPHITVSMAEGVAPKVSNDMLAGAHTFLPLDLELDVVVEFFEFKG